MATPTIETRHTAYRDSANRVPPLESGDHLSRDEFERRFDAMPGLRRAELIEGVVFVPSPIRFKLHATQQADLITWLGVYQLATPGVRSGGNASVRLDLDNEPQPDAVLLIEPTYGGQAVIDSDGYIAGAPEFVIEIASSSVSYDLHTKLNVYRRNGVREYLVWRVLDRAVDWFVLRQTQYDRLPAEAGGTIRSEVFPGLWLDTTALLKGDLPLVHQVLQQGVATPEHAAFVAQLNATPS